MDWRDLASCLGLDTDLFFPDQGMPGISDQAKAVCGECLVSKECMHFALTHDQEFGVWGGTSAFDRIKIKRQRRRSNAA